MAHRHERSLSRRTAVQALFAWEVRVWATKDDKVLHSTPMDLIENGELDVIEGPIDDYAMTLIEGVFDNKKEIDSILEGLSKNWSLERMSLVDLNVIRVATFEIMKLEEIPTSVSIDEAVELAKGFGGEDSHKFVNGILGAIAKKLGKE